MSITRTNQIKNIVNELSLSINQLETSLASISPEEKIKKIAVLERTLQYLKQTEKDLQNSVSLLPSPSESPETLLEVNFLQEQLNQLKDKCTRCYNKCVVLGLDVIRKKNIDLILENKHQNIQTLILNKTQLESYLKEDTNLNEEAKRFINFIISDIDQFLANQPDLKTFAQSPNDTIEDFGPLNYDIWQHVISKLSPEAILTLSLVNKTLNAICNEKYTWQQFIDYPIKQDYLKEVHRREIVSENVSSGHYLTKSFPSSDSHFNAIQFDNGLIYAAGVGSQIMIYDLQGNEVGSLLTNQGSIFSLCVKDRKLFSGSVDGTIQVWDLKNQTCINTIQTSREITSLACHQNELYVGANSGTITVWDVNTLSIKCSLQGHHYRVTCLLTSGTDLFSASIDGSVRIYDLKTKQLKTFLSAYPLKATYPAPIRKICLYKNLLIAAHDDAAIRIWNLDNYSFATTLKGHNSKIFALAIVDDFLISHSDDNSTLFWDLKTFSCISAKQWAFDTIHFTNINNSYLVLFDKFCDKIKSLDFTVNTSQLIDIAQALLNQSEQDAVHFSLTDLYDTLGHGYQSDVLKEFAALTKSKDVNNAMLFLNNEDPITDPNELRLRAKAILRVVFKKVLNLLENKKYRRAFNLFKKLPENFQQDCFDELIKKLGPDAQKLVLEHLKIDLSKR
jgi:hypothetical protein